MIDPDIGQALFAVSAAGGWWLYYLEVRWRLYHRWVPLLATLAVTVAAALRIAVVLLPNTP